MIRNIVFDIGGVLADFRLMEFLTEKGFDGPMIKRILRASVMLKESGLRVYYLSNYSKKAYDECAGSLEFMPYMDGGLVSFLAGRTKPDPEMYRMFLLKYGLRADECVFIDDTEENVEAAKVLGFSGIVFHDYENLLRALSDLGLTELNKTLG